jgi:hypothetical protein
MNKENVIMATRKKKVPEWVGLVTRAVRDPAFRDHLVQDPAGAAKAKRVPIDAKGIAEIKRISRHLKRFGGDPEVARRDAKSWTVGVLSHPQFCLCPDDN